MAWCRMSTAHKLCRFTKTKKKNYIDLIYDYDTLTHVSLNINWRKKVQRIEFYEFFTFHLSLQINGNVCI